MSAVDTPLAIQKNGRELAAQSRRRLLGLLSLTFPALLLVGIIVIAPIGWLFALSAVGADGEWSTENYRRIFESSSYFRTFQTTFEISLIVTAITVILGYPLAYFISLLPKRWARWCLLAVIVPFWTSILVRTYAWLIILQRKGLINNALIDMGLIDEPLRLVHNATGTVIGMVHIMVPFLVFPLYATMQTIDRRLVQAAASMGASPIQAFWLVYFPLSLPGLLAGVALVFVLCLGFFVTPVILGGGRVVMIAVRIQNSVEFYSNWGAASALGLILLVLTFLVLGLAAWLSARGPSRRAGAPLRT